MNEETKEPIAKLYEHIRGDAITLLDQEEQEPLVCGMLYPRDYVLLVAEEKVGKTVFAQHLTCCMSSGTSFLGIFDIPKPLKVLYMATEGKKHDLKERFVRISHKIPTDFNNICLTPTFFFFNTAKGVEQLSMALDDLDDFKPDVVVIDALYRAVSGELTKDAVINAFHHEIGLVQKRYGCAVILVHHMTKPTRNQYGDLNDRSDKDSYGSAFLLAAVDHIFRLSKWTKDKECKKDRLLTCDTQRAGDKIEDIRIRMEEPDPLYFTTVSKYDTEKHRVIEILKSVKGKFLSVADIIQKADIGRTSFFTIKKEIPNLIEEGKGKNKKYSLEL